MPFALAANLTTYFPVNRGSEGGASDCSSRKLITLQQHLSDPDRYPYASVAGDCDAWPDGQRISLPDVHPTAVFRIVDSGSHFHGPQTSVGCTYPAHCKVIRVPGHEPLDVCHDDGTGFGSMQSTVIIYPGDDWGKPLCPGAVSNGVCSGTSQINLSTVVATPIDLGDGVPGGGSRALLAVGLAGVALATTVAVLLSRG